MYRIEITEVTQREQTATEWKHVADSGNERDGGAVYAYVPRTATVNVTRTVLTQEVDVLPLAAVIKAVNGL